MKPQKETVRDILEKREQQNQKKSATKIPKRRFSAIEKRQIEQKAKIIEEIRNVYIPSIACQKTGISRATLYRWLTDDYTFNKEFTRGRMEGRSAINDLVESKLISLIKEGNPKAMMFWLTHMHPNFINPLLAIPEDVQGTKKMSLEHKADLGKKLAQWKKINLN